MQRESHTDDRLRPCPVDRTYEAMKPVIDAILPTYYPDSRLDAVLEKLSRQEMPVRRIRLINTEKEGFDAYLSRKGLDEQAFLAVHPEIDLCHIRKEDFDHGSARNLGAEKSAGADYCLFMTQDAEPEDTKLTFSLLAPFETEPTLAVSYARQKARENAAETEKITRLINYPEVSRLKTAADLEELGIKTFFCSNVCALYRKDVFDREGPFAFPMIFNEDMVYAGRVMKKGYSIYYAADAVVLHSHNYSGTDQFHRNFDLGVSQADYPDVFGQVRSESEGVRYVRRVLKALGKAHAYGEMIPFIYTCGMRLAGYRLGKNYRKLPERMILLLTGNRTYWENLKRNENRAKT